MMTLTFVTLTPTTIIFELLRNHHENIRQETFLKFYYFNKILFNSVFFIQYLVILLKLNVVMGLLHMIYRVWSIFYQ